MMNFQYFIDYLNSRGTIERRWEQELQNRVKEIYIIRGAHLLYPGEPCKYIYFIKSGFFRLYRNHGTKEETTGFAGPGHFATALTNFLTQKSGDQGIVCEASATVYRLSYQDWLDLERLSPQFLHLSKTILQEYLLLINQEKNVYRTSNATKKYIFLCQQYKGISNIVRQKHIASYLGITGPTMSNLIKDLYKKRI